MPGLNDLVVELEDWLPRSRQLEHEYSDLQEDWRPDSEEVDDLPALQERWRILEAQRMTLATRALQLASAFANAPEPQVLSLMLDVFAVSTDEAGAPSRKLCLQLVEQLKKYPEAKLKNATKRWLVHTAVDLARIDCLASLSNTPFMKALCAKLPQGLHDAQSIVRLLLSKLSAEVFSAVMAAFRNGLALGPDALACLLKGSEANLSADLAAALVGQVRGLSLFSVHTCHSTCLVDIAAGLVRVRLLDDVKESRFGAELVARIEAHLLDVPQVLRLLETRPPIKFAGFLSGELLKDAAWARLGAEVHAEPGLVERLLDALNGLASSGENQNVHALMAALQKLLPPPPMGSGRGTRRPRAFKSGKLLEAYWSGRPEVIAKAIHEESLGQQSLGALSMLVEKLRRTPTPGVLLYSQAASAIANAYLSNHELPDSDQVPALISGFAPFLTPQADKEVEAALNKAMAAIRGWTQGGAAGLQEVTSRTLSTAADKVAALLRKKLSEPTRRGVLTALMYVADAVVARRVGPGKEASLPLDFHPVNLSNLANGLSRLLEQDAEALQKASVLAALALIASTVAARAAGAKGKEALPPDFLPINLSNLANGLAKHLTQEAPAWQKGRVQVALALIAATVAARGEQRQGKETLLPLVFNAIDLSSLANQLSKLLEHDCEASQKARVLAALALIAATLAARGRLAKGVLPLDFHSVDLSNLVNGLSRLLKQGADESQKTLARAALALIAATVSARGRSGMGVLPLDFQAVHLSNLANGLSRILRQEADESQKPLVRAALALIAATVVARGRMEKEGLPLDFRSVELSNLANGLSKLLDQELEVLQKAAVLAALALIAATVTAKRGVEKGVPPLDFQPVNLSNLANGLSKLLGHEAEASQMTRVLAALALIASNVVARGGEEKGNEKERGLLSPDFLPVHLCNLANGLSKLLEHEGEASQVARVLAALARIAATLVARGGERGKKLVPRDFTAVGLCSLANGMSRALVHEADPSKKTCALEALRLVDSLVASKAVAGRLPSAFEPVNLAMLAKCLEHLHRAEGRTHAMKVIAATVGTSTPVGPFDALQLAQLLRAFNTCRAEPACLEGLKFLIAYLREDAAFRWTPRARSGAKPQFGVLIYALGVIVCESQLGVDSAPRLDDAVVRSIQQALESIVSALLDAKKHRAVLLGCSELDVAQTLRGLDKAGRLDLIVELAEECLKRLKGSHELSLEGLGALCMALRPFICTAVLAGRRRETLALLVDTILPMGWSKIFARSEPGKVPEKLRQGLPKPGVIGSRNVSLAYRQILRTGYEAVQQYTRKNVDAERRKVLKDKRRDIDAMNKQVLALSHELPGDDISLYSWRLIAELEANSPQSILDDFIVRHAQEIRKSRPPSVFNADNVWTIIGSHSPQLPGAQDGLIIVPRVGMNGKVQGDEPARPRYSILARLSQGKVPLVHVDLPGKLSSYMLGRTVIHEGTKYRADIFGGHDMQEDRVRPKDYFAQANQVAPAESGGAAVKVKRDMGKLYAACLSDTLPDAPFTQFMRRVFPYKETFYYFQRAMMLTPPGEIDRYNQPVQSLYAQWDKEKEQAQLKKDSKNKVDKTEKSATEQTDKAAKKEARRASRRKEMDALRFGPQAHVLEGVFHVAIIPDTAGETPHPFELKDSHGKAVQLKPHDGCGFVRESIAMKWSWFRLAKESKRPFSGTEPTACLPPDALQHYAANQEAAAEIVGNVNDAKFEGVAQFRLATQGARSYGQNLKAVPSASSKVYVPGQKKIQDKLILGHAPYCTPKLQPVVDENVVHAIPDDPTVDALQSWLTLQYTFVGREKVKSEISFMKGLLMVVPDACWPASYKDQQVVFSAEDEKTRTSWTKGKQRHDTEVRLTFDGILAINGIFPGGSCVAVPTHMQKAMSADYDGDEMVLVSGLPKLHALLTRHIEEHGPAPELKLPKSHTPAFDEDDNYEWGRAGQIMSTKLGILGSYTVLQRCLLSLPAARQMEVGCAMLWPVIDGVPEDLRAELENLLFPLPEAAQQRPAQLDALLREVSELADAAVAPAAKAAWEAFKLDLRKWIDEKAPEPGKEPEQLLAEKDALRLVMGSYWAGRIRVGTKPAQRLLIWLEWFSRRQDLGEEVSTLYKSGAYATAANLILSQGIKAGEDAFKSDTSIRFYDRLKNGFRMRMSELGVPSGVPYGKGTARALAERTFDAKAALKDLEGNPTLAGVVMRQAVQQLDKAGKFAQQAPKPSKAKKQEAPPASKEKVDAIRLRMQKAYAGLMSNFAKTPEAQKAAVAQRILDGLRDGVAPKTMRSLLSALQLQDEKLRKAKAEKLLHKVAAALAGAAGESRQQLATLSQRLHAWVAQGAPAVPAQAVDPSHAAVKLRSAIHGARWDQSPNLPKDVLQLHACGKPVEALRLLLEAGAASGAKERSEANPWRRIRGFDFVANNIIKIMKAQPVQPAQAAEGPSPHAAPDHTPNQESAMIGELIMGLTLQVSRANAGAGMGTPPKLDPKRIPPRGSKVIYHEAQREAWCGIHTGNMMAMYLLDNEPSCLIDETVLEQNAESLVRKEASPNGTVRRFVELGAYAEYFNSFIRPIGAPCLLNGRGVLNKDNSIEWVGPPPRLEGVRAAGLTFGSGGAGDHSVFLAESKTQPGSFFLFDPLERKEKMLVEKENMTNALAAAIRKVVVKNPAQIGQFEFLVPSGSTVLSEPERLMVAFVQRHTDANDAVNQLALTKLCEERKIKKEQALHVIGQCHWLLRAAYLTTNKANWDRLSEAAWGWIARK